MIAIGLLKDINRIIWQSNLKKVSLEKRLHQDVTLKQALGMSSDIFARSTKLLNINKRTDCKP